MKAYKGPYSKVNGAYGGIDDLGRALTTDASLPLPRENRSVGIFYYLAPGNHGLRGIRKMFLAYGVFYAVKGSSFVFFCFPL